MKITRRQLLKLLKEEINASTVDAGEFPWPGRKPWWANSAVAFGEWNANDNLIYDLKEKNKELNSKFLDMVKEDLPPEAKVTGGGAEIQKKGIFGFLKSKKKASSTDKPVSLPKPTSTGVGIYRKLSNESDLSYGNQAIFSNLADRYFIGMELKRFEDSEGQEYLKKLMGDIEFLVDFDNNGSARKGIVLAKLSSHYKSELSLVDKFNQSTKGSGKSNISIKSGSDKETKQDFSGEYYGPVGDDMIYTYKGDKTYVYKKSKEAPNGWVYATIKDYKTGNPNWKNINRAGANNLNVDEKQKKLEANPMSIKESRRLNRHQIQKMIIKTLNETRR